MLEIICTFEAKPIGMKQLFSVFKYGLLIFVLGISNEAEAQKKKPLKVPEKTSNADVFGGFKFRSLGPAFMSGRIADIAIHPENQHIWYVAVGSGGLWKTENSGTTWRPIFENQAVYSTGCVGLDPKQPEVIWLGTGENVGGRHVGYGDGVYKSEDGGNSWKNMGLKASEHISKICVHPENSNKIWVAAQGSLWKEGGDRGVFLSEDGGLSWQKVLGDDSWIGATDLVIDPKNPDVLYAATWQRQRTVAAYLGGGKGSGIYKSTNGGKQWTKLENGLPTGHLGKIGLAISPQKSEVIYAAIETDRRNGSVYRSENGGSSWTKMSDAVSGATGPHYYQELYASPHQFDRIYLVDYMMQISDDGGKSFRLMNEKNKHVDNHAIAFRPNDPNYLLVGTDGGLYETFDQTAHWRFVANLPVTQFYKLAVDDAQPFYNIYGGTQDNNTQGGPSRTTNSHGISNSNWFVILGGDGHQPATEPGNPNIVYAQWQQGNLNRHDRTTGENVYIKPLAKPDEPAERYNWDAPVLVSPHNPKRLYFASQRVWKSEDRGDSWTTVSGDLTQNIDRITTPMFGGPQSWDNAWDLYAMSSFSTITSISESPVKEGLLYVGTDDGKMHCSENAGLSWREIPFGVFPGLPASAFVNDIKADKFDEKTVYAAFDHHKAGDFSPYLYKSVNAGISWVRLKDGLPDKTLCWRLVQDHIQKDLWFLGTEFGAFVSQNAGLKWQPLKGQLPCIPVRDLTIQKGENDLVLATFGRGIFILDDISALRQPHDKVELAKVVLFEPRKAWLYEPEHDLGHGKKASQGDSYFMADNPPFGAEFTYYLQEVQKTKKTIRQEAEKEKQAAAFPGWDSVEIEIREQAPKLYLTIFDKQGVMVNRIEAPYSKGYQRVVWDLNAQSADFIHQSNMGSKGMRFKVEPGSYVAVLQIYKNGHYENLGNTTELQVERLRSGSLLPSKESLVLFKDDLGKTMAESEALEHKLNDANKSLQLLAKVYERAKHQSADWEKDYEKALELYQGLDLNFRGSKARAEVGEEPSKHNVNDYLSHAYQSGTSTYGPSQLSIEMLSYAKALIMKYQPEVERLSYIIEELERSLESLGVPKFEKH